MKYMYWIILWFSSWTMMPQTMARENGPLAHPNMRSGVAVWKVLKGSAGVCSLPRSAQVWLLLTLSELESQLPNYLYLQWITHRNQMLNFLHLCTDLFCNCIPYSSELEQNLCHLEYICNHSRCTVLISQYKDNRWSCNHWVTPPCVQL